MKQAKGKAQEVYDLAKIMEEFKAGDNVKFAPGHPLDGTLGVIVAINPDGTFGVKVGKALQPPVEAGMLIAVDYAQTANNAQVTTDKPAATPA